ncbi:pirin family protein [Ideonella paludis]|uniref:Pirin family protein n=1 Tax=Ideonella paludis TaxID=1233411 RepID=A0ABS5E0A5_9BURK|nr:pirin family protein [Ideonella paludis]MBQ0936835.1 pirin family protein [Ideonella paludis]
MPDATPILAIQPLGFPWQTLDPFLFCVYHLDSYPAGDDAQGVPRAALAGRPLGNDFEPKDGWRMYHGQHVPGFPRHPHRGFETITIARQGFIDHADSLGATARFGQGDVQWMTAGRGIEHSEMFPLRQPAAPNTTELFQLWLNLPARNKLVQPHFSMLWGHTLPHLQMTDAQGLATEVCLIAGSLGEHKAPAPPPHSWAAEPDNHLAVWTLRMAPGARWTLPAGVEGVNRALYSFSQAAELDIAGHRLKHPAFLPLSATSAIELENRGSVVAEFLYLQGRPISEPVVPYGPFVMNTAGEIQQAMQDYRQGLFGRWPWPSDGPVHARDQARFAIHADGRREDPPLATS